MKGLFLAFLIFDYESASEIVIKKYWQNKGIQNNISVKVTQVPLSTAETANFRR